MITDFQQEYLNGIVKQFQYYKKLGDRTFIQMKDNSLLFKQVNNESNSIAIIVNHMHGNMLSRWTNFLEEDGEKSWRKRDQEFENIIKSKEELLTKWDQGWECLFNALDTITDDNCGKTIYIRNMGHSVVDAINRQLAHYAYHVGQIVFIGKMMCDDSWESLSIPKGQSKDYNKEKFNQEKEKKHFTDEFLKDD